MLGGIRKIDAILRPSWDLSAPKDADIGKIDAIPRPSWGVSAPKPMITEEKDVI